MSRFDADDEAGAGGFRSGRSGAGSGRAVLRIIALWRGQAGRLTVGMAVSVLSVLAGVTLLAAAGGTTVSGGRASLRVAGIVLVAGLALRALGVGRIVLRYVERMATHDAMFRALADLRIWLFRRIADGAASGLGFRRSADLLSRLVTDVEALDSLYLRINVPLVGALCILPVLVVALARLDLVLGLVVGALFVGSAIVLPAVAARTAGRAGVRLASRQAGLRVTVLDTVAGLREVRAFGAEGRMLAAAQGREAALIAAQLDLGRRTATADAIAFLLGQAALLAVLAAIAVGVTGGGAAAVALAPAIVAVFVVLGSFEVASALPRAGVLAGHAGAAAQRVVDAADHRPPEANVARRAGMPAASLLADGRTLRFENVRFGWAANRLVFDGLSLEIPAGSRVALLGPSGAGKSTIAALALGLAAPDAGRVTLGGVDVGAVDPLLLRREIALLDQATHLFADTIGSNLLIARPDATEAELWRALDRAEIGGWVRGLPDGLSTWLGEGGHTVSGGQGRRLALARALLMTAPVLILDEPGTGLDGDTERAFLRTLNDVDPGRTIVLITHRLTGVEKLDRIWRFAGGRAAAATA